VRDIFCHADIADPAASADTGMITLRAGESASIRITSPAAADPAAFAAALRCANDLLG
jgi:beta-mannosidase